MTWLERQIKQRQEQISQLYNPHTAFGNVELIALKNAIEEDRIYLETHQVCSECEGKGQIGCVCVGCDNEHEKDCTRCGGEGYVECAIAGEELHPGLVYKGKDGKMYQSK